MKKILLTILILAGAVGIYFSYTQHQELEALIKDRKSLIDQNTRQTGVLHNKEEERQAATGLRDSWNGQRGTKQALVTNETDRNQQLTTQKNDIETQYVAKQTQFNKIQEELATYNFSDPQEIIDRNDQAKEKNQQLLASMEEMNVLTEEQARKNGVKEEQLLTMQKRQEEYRAKLAANSREYMVTAVDPQWGFVIVNAGQESTITPQTVLLVARGGKSVAKLRVSSLERSQTVADVVEGSLKAGNRVEVGDHVILLNPQG